MRLKTVFAFVLSLCSVTVLAQDVKDFSFFHLGLADGMYSQRVFSIVQTADGAVWMASKSGVDRYNGAAIRNYQLDHNRAGSGLSVQTTKLFGRANNDELGAFDNNGRIYSYIPSDDSFELMADISDYAGHDMFPLNAVYDDGNCLWLAMQGGVLRMQNGQVQTVVADVNANSIIGHDNRLIVCTKHGVLQLGTDGQLLSKSFDHLYVETAFYDTSSRLLWLGTFNDGVVVTDVECRQSVSDLRDGIPHNPVRSIVPMNDSVMLVGVDGFGVYAASRRTFDAKLFVDANDGRQGMLHGNGVYAIMCDRWSNIYIGTYAGGVDIARPVSGTTAIFQHVPGNQQSLVNDRVNCVKVLADGTLMFGTDDGISVFDAHQHRWINFLKGSVVLDLCTAADGHLYAATYGSGVYRIDGSSAKQVYSVENGTITDNYVFSLEAATDGGLWVGCLDGPLTCVSPGGITRYDVRNVQDLALLPNGDVAVATAYGVLAVTPGNESPRTIEISLPEGEKVCQFAASLFVDVNGDLWIATDGGGVYICKPSGGACRWLTMENGLPSNCVCDIRSDERGRIWMSTDRGLAFVADGQSDHVTCVNSHYGVDREYTYGASCQALYGHMLYGSTSGAIIINPDRMDGTAYEARLTLRRLVVPDNPDEPLCTDMHTMLSNRDICLSYSQRTFELYFESINLSNSHDIAYQYKLAGGEWSPLSLQPYIRFANMEPGDQTLSIRSVSQATGIVLDEVTVDISIGNPWWNTWWMWCVYVLMLVVAFDVAWRVYQLHSKYMRLTIEAARSIAVTGAMQTPSDRTADTPAADDSLADTDDFVDRVTKTVVDNIADAGFNIDRLCQEMGMSRTLFYVRLKSLTGQSPQDFMRVIRLERAASLLRQGQMVADVAEHTGFENAKYFSTVFKKYFGVSPSKYK